MSDNGLVTWRCPECGNILARHRLAPGSYLEVKCKCNAFCVYDVVPSPGILAPLSAFSLGGVDVGGSTWATRLPRP